MAINLTQQLGFLIGNQSYVNKAQIQLLMDQFDLNLDTLMLGLLDYASGLARTPVSGFKVGAVAYAERTKRLYFGANLEFSNAAIHHTLHAEQAAINNALLHGEQGISRLAVSAAPCGHCRQFLQELGNDAGKLSILIAAENAGYSVHQLDQLLPMAFGPNDLGVAATMFSNPTKALASLNAQQATPLWNAAYSAACASYAPYTKRYAGVAFGLSDGKVIRGYNLECAAYNPSISATVSALSFCVLNRCSFEDIRQIAWVEAKSSAEQYREAQVLIYSVIGEIRIDIAVV